MVLFSRQGSRAWRFSMRERCWRRVQSPSVDPAPELIRRHQIQLSQVRADPAPGEQTVHSCDGPRPKLAALPQVSAVAAGRSHGTKATERSRGRGPRHRDRIPPVTDSLRLAFLSSANPRASVRFGEHLLREKSNAGNPVDTRNQRALARTTGSPRVCVAVLDGPVDRTHPCFEGSDLSSLETYWQDVERARATMLPTQPTSAASSLGSMALPCRELPRGAAV